MTDSPAEVFVALQYFPENDLSGRGQLAPGLLVGAEWVMIPDPPEILLERGTCFNVIIAFTRSGQDQIIERPEIAETQAISADGVERAAAVMLLRLSESTACPPHIHGLSRSRLRAALAERGSFWAALEQMGAVSNGLRAKTLAGIPPHLCPPSIKTRPEVNTNKADRTANCDVPDRTCTFIVCWP